MEPVTNEATLAELLPPSILAVSNKNAVPTARLSCTWFASPTVSNLEIRPWATASSHVGGRNSKLPDRLIATLCASYFPWAW